MPKFLSVSEDYVAVPPDDLYLNAILRGRFIKKSSREIMIAPLAVVVSGDQVLTFIDKNDSSWSLGLKTMVRRPSRFMKLMKPNGREIEIIIKKECYRQFELLTKDLLNFIPGDLRYTSSCRAFYVPVRRIVVPVSFLILPPDVICRFNMKDPAVDGLPMNAGEFAMNSVLANRNDSFLFNKDFVSVELSKAIIIGDLLIPNYENGETR